MGINNDLFLSCRRHSMDGLEDNSGAGSSHLSADTSQDEIDAYSPKHKYNRYPSLRGEGGLGGAMAVLAEDSSSMGSGMRGSPLAAAGGEGKQERVCVNYYYVQCTVPVIVTCCYSRVVAAVSGGFVTTDDESVGGRAGGAGRSKLRRPRAKLFGQAASPLHAASVAAHRAAVTSSDPSGAAAAGGAETATGAVAASDSDTSAAAAVSVGAAGKPKRRVRAGGGLGSKSGKESSHLSNDTAAVPAAATVSPWDQELDHW